MSLNTTLVEFIRGRFSISVKCQNLFTGFFFYSLHVSTAKKHYNDT